MVGHNSVVYTGQVIVRQWQLEDGGYFANFYSPDGTLLSVGTAQGSGAPDIFSMYKTKDVNGKLQRGLYIAPGGKDVFGLLQDSFSGEAPDYYKIHSAERRQSNLQEGLVQLSFMKPET
jgi:hypothetical protein